MESCIPMKKICLDWLENHKIDLLVWFIFLFYEITVVGLISKKFGHPVTYLFHYGINISVFYLHATWLFPWSMKKGMVAIWRIPMILLVELIAYTLIAYKGDMILINLNIITYVKEIKLTPALALTSAYRCIYFLGFATGYYFIGSHIRERKRTAEIEKQSLIKHHEMETELTKAQNAFLKAQINPHFLFNTLDFVYHNIDVESNKASEAIVLLSRMMRYAVRSDENRDFILLEDEIEQIENLLYLHQLRKDNEWAIQLVCSSEVRKIKFIPMVLLTLVENITKHTDFACSIEHEATVKVYIDEKNLYIETDNLIDTNNKKTSEHIGLINIQKRLEYAYGQSVSFKYHVDWRNHFVIRICTSLDSLNVHDMPLDVSLDNDRLLFHVDADPKQIND